MCSQKVVRERMKRNKADSYRRRGVKGKGNGEGERELHWAENGETGAGEKRKVNLYAITWGDMEKKREAIPPLRRKRW